MNLKILNKKMVIILRMWIKIILIILNNEIKNNKIKDKKINKNLHKNNKILMIGETGI